MSAMSGGHWNLRNVIYGLSICIICFYVFSITINEHLVSLFDVHICSVFQDPSDMWMGEILRQTTTVSCLREIR